MVNKRGTLAEYRCYNIDFSREFRYYLEPGLIRFRPTTARKCTLLCRRQLIDLSLVRILANLKIQDNLLSTCSCDYCDRRRVKLHL